MSGSPPNLTPQQLAHVQDLLEHFEQIEAEFQLVRDGLTHSHRLTTLGTIASMVAHEYHNILTPMISYCQMALMAPDDAPLMHKAIEKALTAGQRAAQISSSILDFARESGDPESAAHLRQAIDDTLSCLARDPGKDGVELIIETPDVVVAMSSIKLQQVLINLILNALQAMRSMGKKVGRLSITGRVEGAALHLEVADTGPGVPTEILDRLFEPFVSHRPDKTNNSLRLVGAEAPNDDADSCANQMRGTGLGLCICRDLVRQAGGQISVTSRPGAGATFHLELPIADHPAHFDEQSPTLALNDHRS